MIKTFIRKFGDYFSLNHQPSVFDITPTILYALGNPIAKDMDGCVIVDIFTEDFLTENPAQYIDTYDTIVKKDEIPIESSIDEEIKERLRSLGYIE